MYQGLRPGSVRMIVAVLVAVAGLLAAMLAFQPAAAADNPYQRGPDPTLAGVAASRGPFATAQMSVAPGNGFNGGTVYYPTDTSAGTWGAVAIVPGYTALFADEEAWMGPWLSSFGFVVIGIETNSRTDYDAARGTQLLAALDYLTQRSPVRDRVDTSRLSVIGHSMGGGGVVYASEHRPSLKAAVALAPFSPSQNMSTDQVPTMVMAGQNDTVVTPSYLDGLYATMPAAAQSDFVQIAGADHVYYTHPQSTEMRLLIPWLKIFVDNDTRYTQFLCPSLADPSGISIYHSKCPYVPPGGTTSGGTTSGGTTTGGTTTGGTTTGGTTTGGTTTGGTVGGGTTSGGTSGGACTATYTTVNTWSGGFQGEVKVTAGGQPISGWTVRWTLGSGQSISQVWNGAVTTSGSDVSVGNVSYNGSLQPSTSTTFGFLGAGAPTDASLSCTSP
ncbi:cellulose binding domain-containing protein [Streptomyces cocklensis]|uniref:Alpha/beta hydrolase family protein n=1 Tax=Actinacidiphila cocklensis TaxID=887465 RepID=A0A9W4DY19_9ACTN|nr:cellulose binding domain-containing protein [Actinacidiphila cocklensis]MDD1059964.1 cellulose binding domain-containing protein [Actinacidiphila cocklensis]CAG6397974.1 Alpha/beta hydrolase family protein [Actinacidiphila cocklensis]